MTASYRGRVLGMLLAWLGLATIAGMSGKLAALHPPVPLLIVVGLTVALIVLERRAQWFRGWVAGVSVRAMVALPLTRLPIGIVFLVVGLACFVWASGKRSGYDSVEGTLKSTFSSSESSKKRT